MHVEFLLVPALLLEAAPARERVHDPCGLLPPAPAGATACRRAVRGGRDSSSSKRPVRGRAHGVPQGRGAAPTVDLRAARPLPDRRGVLPRGEFDKAIKEFEGFLAFYPRHEIADLVQYRLAMSYYDQMKPVEQDQGITAQGDGAVQGSSCREYPESRYASDALAKIDVCRGRLAQKELWVAAYYINQGNPRGGPPAAGEGAEGIPPHARDPGGAVPAGRGHIPAKDEPRTPSVCTGSLADEYPYTEWGRRAAQRLRAAAR